MISLITGHTGSGKTYLSIKLMLEDIKKDRVILTNIKLNIYDDNIHFFADDDLLALFLEFAKIMEENPVQEVAKDKLRQHKYANSAIYVDEAHFCGFRNKNEHLNSFLTIHRHMGLDIYLITQTSSNIWRNHLELVHKHYMALPSSSRIMPSLAKIRIYEPYGSKDYTLMNYKMKKEIFELYHSGKKEFSINKDFVKLGLILIVIIGLALYSYRSIGGFLGGKVPKKNTKSNDMNTSSSAVILDNIKKEPDIKSRIKICDDWRMTDFYTTRNIDITNSPTYVLKSKEGKKYHYIKSICYHYGFEPLKSPTLKRGRASESDEVNGSSLPSQFFNAK